MAAHQAPPSLGFSRQEHWSGLPFPSPMHESEKWKWSRSVVSDPQRPHGLQPSRLLHPWDFPGKSTGVGCHCLLHLLLLIKTQILSDQGPVNFNSLLKDLSPKIVMLEMKALTYKFGSWHNSVHNMEENWDICFRQLLSVTIHTSFTLKTSFRTIKSALI